MTTTVTNPNEQNMKNKSDGGLDSKTAELQRFRKNISS